MTELFIEIFSEEIPARMQERAGADVSKALTDGLKKAGLSADNIQSLTGPRRLIYVADVPLKSPDVSDERKGPRVGAPEQALAGFMKAAGLTDISQAEIKSDKKGEFYIAKIEKAGQPTADIISALLPEVMNNFPWPKSMKSGGASFRWVRPLQGIICLLDGDVVDMEIGGVKTGNVTEGHRRHGVGPYTVKGFDDYKTKLEGKGHVTLDAQARKSKILTDANALCAAAGLELVEDQGLLNEVAGLAEYPNVILGDMDPSFLELPSEVIRLSMRTHQKYFAVRDPKTGGLAPNFIVVANQAAPDGGTAIAKGNSKVLSARLADAQFFQSEDAKKKLEDYYDKLGTVVFHKKLGSIKDKAERVAALARELAPKVGADPDAAQTAAKLAKCDLVTQTVIEFTSLEGQIGAQMYRKENSPHPEASRKARDSKDEGVGAGETTLRDAANAAPQGEGQWSAQEHESIALAIEQHYKPKGPSDAVPTDPVAVTVALADKLDTLVGFWAIDEKPTGSKDPFALRRAALGVVRIILENEVRLELGYVLERQMFESLDAHFGMADDHNFSGKLYEEVKLKLFDRSDKKLTVQELYNDVMEREVSNKWMENVFNSYHVVSSDLFKFITERLKVYLKDKNIRHDLCDAVFALISVGEDDLVAIVNRTNALQDFLGTSEGENLLAGYKRAANILKAEGKKAKANKESLPTGAPSKPKQAEAVALYDALQTAAPAIETALEGENYAEAMQNLAKLRSPIDAFFDHVTVVSDDSVVRENNLRLLAMIRDTARQIADFEAIQG